MTVSRIITLCALACAALVAGCGGGDDSSAGGKVVLRYGLWDSNQTPVYQKCADAFQKQNPNIKIVMDQKNWNDYWGGLSRGFIADTAPDVFTDHLAKYPQFATSEVIEPISTNGVDMNQYLPGLARLWKTPSGKQYGLPKDWDTVAIVANLDMLKAAGLTKEQLDNATWNPKDGGTFQQIVAKLSVDKNGKRGDEPGFDPKNVKTYGLALDAGGFTYGQTTWAGFARSLGFQLLNKNPWGTHYNYDDPRFIQTIAWWRHMIEKGYMPTVAQARTLGALAAVQAGSAALNIDGDWTVSAYTSNKDQHIGFSPQPRGPEGSWSMYNGLADGIWVGSKHKPEARKWVAFLGSKQCQSIVGSEAVVFPAIASEVPKAVAKHKKDGVDVSAFTSYIKDKHTILYPITEKAAQINLVVQPTIENILIGSEDAEEALPKMNDQVNNLLKFQ
jgi:multiple sugar transport system substrate-binding protein